MSFLNKEKLTQHLSKIISETEKKEETVEVQISLKGYDLKKDVRFDGNVVLPYKKRETEKVVIIGDKKLEEEATALGLPFISFESVQGKTKDKVALKKKIAQNHHGVITLNTFNRFFEITYFNRKRTPFYFVKPNTDLKTLYDEIVRTVKFKLRNNTVLSFAAGTVELGEEKLSENIGIAVDFLITLLKKGVSNIDSISIKSTFSSAVKVY